MLMVILLATVLKEAIGPMIEGTVLMKLGTNMISLFLVFGLLYWVSMSRLIRGQILSLREQEYVLAARATGAKGSWIIENLECNISKLAELRKRHRCHRLTHVPKLTGL
jgi:oligopeptide transport system permease protein